jgi:hypothetical protein
MGAPGDHDEGARVETERGPGVGEDVPMADEDYPDEYCEWWDTEAAEDWDEALAQVMHDDPQGYGVDAEQALFGFYTEFGGSRSVDIWASPKQIPGGYEVPLVVRRWLQWERWWDTPVAVHWAEALAQVMDEETPGEGVDTEQVLFDFYTEFNGASSVNIKVSPKQIPGGYEVPQVVWRWLQRAKYIGNYDELGSVTSSDEEMADEPSDGGGNEGAPTGRPLQQQQRQQTRQQSSQQAQPFAALAGPIQNGRDLLGPALGTGSAQPSGQGSRHGDSPPEPRRSTRARHQALLPSELPGSLAGSAPESAGASSAMRASHRPQHPQAGGEGRHP